MDLFNMIYKVYRNPSTPSSIILPLAANLLAKWKCTEKIATIAIIKMCDPIETHIAVGYLGASWYRTMKLPAMPPAPFKAVTVAAVKARFHCPVMLFAWYADKAAQFET